MSTKTTIQIFKSLACVLFIHANLFCGCRKGPETINQDGATYNVVSVFGHGTKSLALAKAASRGDQVEIAQLVSEGVDVNATGENDITPLLWAVWSDNFTGFSALLEKGANPNTQRSKGKPLMWFIAGINDPRYLEAALKHGGDPNLKNAANGESPLFVAISNNRKPQIEALLAAKPDLNIQNSISGETLPMAAMTRADYQMVFRLLQMGSDPSLKTKSGSTLIDYIETRSVNATNNSDPWRTKVLEFLAAKGLKPDGNLKSPAQSQP